MRRELAKTLVQQTGSSSASGTAVARIAGLHPLLYIKVALAWVGQRPGSFGSNAFSLHAFDRVADSGELVALSSTPVNGDTGQAAPDAWEGRIGVAELQLTHAYQGVGNAGRWAVLVSVAPVQPMCEADFDQLAAAVQVLAPDPVVLS